MKPEDQEFASLKKLLSVKRHEQPPPGYFNDLPRNVWKRIEANEARPSFWERVLPAFALKPSVAYASGLVICGTLIVVIGTALRTEDQPTPAGTFIVENPHLQVVPVGFGLNNANAEKAASTAAQGSSTNPILDPGALYPNKLNSQDIAPVGYTP